MVEVAESEEEERRKRHSCVMPTAT